MFTFGLPIGGPVPGALAPLIGAETARADLQDRRETRRVVRQTMRRIERRQDRRERYVHTLPGLCSAVTLNGLDYYRCGRLYYEPALLDDRIVYVVVNPR